MIGTWLKPWPGEDVLGQVVAVSGENLVLRCKGGLLIQVALADVPKMVNLGDYTTQHHGPAHRSWRLTAAGEAATRRDLPLIAN